MSGLVEWTGEAPVSWRVARQQKIQRQALAHTVELAEALVQGVAQVGVQATVAMTGVEMTRRRAEELAPDGAPLYALIAAATGTGMANVINRLSRI